MQLFQLAAHGSTVRRELVAGCTTFLMMASIIFINPDILASVGMDHGAVFVATCLAAAVGSAVMGLWANYPIAQAPGLGINALFAFGLVQGMGLSWQQALAVVFVSGVLFLACSLSRLRAWFVDGIPATLKHAITGGVGLFIAFISLHQAGLVVPNPDTLLQFGGLQAPGTWLAILGFVIIVALDLRRVPGAILLGVCAVTALAAATVGLERSSGALLSLPPSLAPTWLALDFSRWHDTLFLGVAFGFFLMSLTETSGTLIAIAGRGGFLDADGRLPRAGRAFSADSLAIVVGALLGTSSTTSYIESTAGIAAGGRTGLTACVVAGLFLLCLFLAPLAALVPSYATAPALLYVSLLMVKSLADIDWSDLTESLPGFVTAVVMAFTFSIADGIAFGMLSFIGVKLLAGRAGEIPRPLWLVGALLASRYLLAL